MTLQCVTTSGLGGLEYVIEILQFKSTVTPAERCDFVSVKLEKDKFRNFFMFFSLRTIMEWRNYMAQYGSFYYKRQCN